MSITVVIPVFNSAHFVAEAIDSVLAQTNPADEVIVIDDGSEDRIQETMARFGQAIRYLWQSNQGPSAARNKGVCAASADWVAFLDADDVWHPRKLELQMQLLRSRPDIGLLAASDFAWPAPAFPQIDGTRSAGALTLPLLQMVVENCFATSSVIVRRTVFQAAGGFDVALRGSEDRDLWCRIAEIATVAKVGLPLVGYRTVAGSLSAQPGLMEAGGYTRLRKADQRGLWGRNRLHRRQAYSYHCFACRNCYDRAGEHWRALWCLLKSLSWYPLPYRPGWVRTPCARIKAFGVTALRCLRPKSTSRGVWTARETLVAASPQSGSA